MGDIFPYDLTLRYSESPGVLQTFLRREPNYKINL